MTFAEISEVTRVSKEDVELLVMKSMSIGLVRGIIDQVDETIRISWVKPRMLTADKISVMKDKMGAWKDLCEDTFKQLESQAEELC